MKQTWPTILQPKTIVIRSVKISTARSIIVHARVMCVKLVEILGLGKGYVRNATFRLINAMDAIAVSAVIARTIPVSFLEKKTAPLKPFKTSLTNFRRTTHQTES